ncbi:HD domain-containing protein [Photobacterium sp. ZSDE20]|uniref:HD domain-containing protein n=1 Tax=Photobacterium pectinilyticum TaxID=2906793 RepID=A0ABT1N0X7_9GAMM|nr:HD domain-containing phosphohydrolase [Photobacterium sp. ZSDE20]MCQ1058393.1 HD domain-containing protein [Photobacterium sp. ZSDE20]MDD1825244.1 HD domain-containing protein [Photobacterium sp. ZSDE20]
MSNNHQILGVKINKSDQAELTNSLKQLDGFIWDMLIGLSAIAENVTVDQVHAHTRRCMAYTRIILDEMLISSMHDDDRDLIKRRPEYYDLIPRCCGLHDIGKSQIPDHLLNKPGKLSTQEFSYVKEHTLNPFETFFSFLETHNTNPFIIILKDCVKHHHERYDGSGYPLQLSGNDIPLVARIMAVVDVIDALTTDSSYSRRRSVDETFDFLISQRGIAFDPYVIDATFRQRQKIQAIANQDSQ